MKSRVEEIVLRLDMNPHPEGGYYKEVYRSKQVIPKNVLGKKFTGERCCCTAIYFLLTSDNFSAFHKINQDEIWHYYEGSSLYVHVIDPAGNYSKYSVGINLDIGESPQLVVPADCWFASEVKNKDSYSLVGCTVSPGFDFDDFELADRGDLIQKYPDCKDIITRLTRDQ
ncbi:cupin domain-containing protein [Aquimarina sediminis]|uniref:cupin domain-containing protein n=1 Tax=Aquimarina sediminis TaxID=2070536 RepID=UPI000CA020ED|nr:cupin domain-containing protein [Aquimarina sediminis]